MHSGLMEGRLFEEARWRVRLEGRKAQSKAGHSVPSSPVTKGVEVGDGAVVKKHTMLEELKLPMRIAGMFEGRGSKEVEVNGKA